MTRISQSSAARIAEGIRKAERLTEGPPAAQVVQQGTLKAWVRITSTTQSAGRYPGKWVYPTDHATDGGDVWVLDANGVALATGKFYEARLREYAGSPEQAVYETDRDAAGSGAPVDAQYIVAATNATLTAERVLTNTNTVAWDFSTAGQAKANVPGATSTVSGVVTAISSGTVQHMGMGAKVFDGVRTPSIEFASGDGPYPETGAYIRIQPLSGGLYFSLSHPDENYAETQFGLLTYDVFGNMLEFPYFRILRQGGTADVILAEGGWSVNGGGDSAPDPYGNTFKGGLWVGGPAAPAAGSIPVSDGTSFGADPSLTFDPSTNALTLGGGGYLISTRNTAPTGTPTNSISGPWFGTNPGP